MDLGAMGLAISGLAITLFLATTLSKRDVIDAHGRPRPAAMARSILVDSVIRYVYLCGSILSWVFCLPIVPIYTTDEHRGLAFIVLIACGGGAVLCACLAALNKEAAETLAFRAESCGHSIRLLEAELCSRGGDPVLTRSQLWRYHVVVPALASIPVVVLWILAGMSDGEGVGGMPGALLAATVSMLLCTFGHNEVRGALVTKAQGRRWWAAGLCVWCGLWCAGFVGMLAVILRTFIDPPHIALGVLLTVVIVAPTLVPLLTVRAPGQQKLLRHDLLRRIEWIEQVQTG